MKQEWLLIDPMVDLFDQIEEGVEFAESANPPIPGGKVVTIAYLMIIRTGGIKKTVNSGKTSRFDCKNGRILKYHFSQAYRRYQIRKKATAAAHGSGESTNHTQEIEAQFNTEDVLQPIACAAMEDKNSM